MRIGRVLSIPAILVLGVAGSILSGSAMPVATVHAPAVHMQPAAVSLAPQMYYHL
jgi:hypothetical protein